MGRHKHHASRIPSTQASYKLSYTQIPKDIDGWVLATAFFPEPFDLVLLKCDTITVPGWWDGHVYFARKLHGNTVRFWKVMPYYCKHFS